MKIDYKKELESASKGMIMIHDPKLLIKLIIRMIVRNLKIKHAAMILYDPERNAYVLSISRGESGFKIPAGFTRFYKENPLIKLFTHDEYKFLIVDRHAIVAHDINRMIWREGVVDKKNGNGIKEILHHVDQQMQMLNSVACVPAYYRKELMAVLLLGEKADGTKYEQEELSFFAALASDVAMAIRNAQLFNSLEREAKRNRELFIQAIMVLTSTIEAKDIYTHGHTERVTKYALAIARQMEFNQTAKFEKPFFENLYFAGLLHDIGKIAIPEKILNKSGKLTPEEFKMMRQHTRKGVEMIKPLNLPQDCIDGILYHHERYDGLGYPDGLKGEEIPLAAAILCVADSYDAMTSDRPYRKGLNRALAMEEIASNIGKQFNAIPAKALLELIKSQKI